ncbi:hypothetical protein E4U42_005924 [Claviceps africana]|uniref:Uncharacterized protein n=1 Tax=Claviceps africana TaxID=83212 RepID=A0A8K0NG23_9HYPO|nr:hypothetical protein E4U42_005924 [Claviceps africana]
MLLERGSAGREVDEDGSSARRGASWTAATAGRRRGGGSGESSKSASQTSQEAIRVGSVGVPATSGGASAGEGGRDDESAYME